MPAHVVGQILFGVLHTHPRPAPRHARATTQLGQRLGRAFDGGSDGGDGGTPGGWLLLDEPELHLMPHVIVPDLTGWRRERLPQLRLDRAYFDLAPDWVCEVLSPGTAKIDRGEKRRIYAAFGVDYLWFVEPDLQTLEVLKLDGETYRVVDVYAQDEIVRAVPFDAVELPLATLWAW